MKICQQFITIYIVKKKLMYENKSKNIYTFKNTTLKSLYCSPHECIQLLLADSLMQYFSDHTVSLWLLRYYNSVPTFANCIKGENQFQFFHSNFEQKKKKLKITK